MLLLNQRVENDMLVVTSLVGRWKENGGGGGGGVDRNK